MKRVITVILLAVAAVGAIAAIVVILVTQGSKTKTPVVSKPRVAARSLHLSLVGNDGKCSRNSDNSFHFRVTGARPGDTVQVLVRAPRNWQDPTYQNDYNFYWWVKNFGIRLAPASGVIDYHKWHCGLHFGPANTTDVFGPYHARAVEWEAGKISNMVVFHDVL